MNTKIAGLKKLFTKFDIDFYIVPSQDEFLGEYTTDHSSRLKYITGFTGSNGLALFSKEGQDYLFTDGRYLLQAKSQLEGNFKIIDMSVNSLADILSLLLCENKKIGIDPKLHNIMQVNNLIKNFSINQFVFVEKNLIDFIWGDRPKRHYSNVGIHPLEYSGEPTSSKIRKIISRMQKDCVEFFIATDPHSVCWLLNIRGRDLQYTPLVLSNAILATNGSVGLFCNNNCDDNVIKYFEDNNITLFRETDFSSELKKITENKVLISNKSSYWVRSHFQDVEISADYCELPKACKNEIEINGTIQAHIRDGRAVAKLLNWIDDTLESGEKITELDVSAKVLELRSEEKYFKTPSFPTIAGFKNHGAIIHYNPTKATNKAISGDGMLLIDSGGQYLDGTTDITRTICIGEPTEEQKHDFTLVLKGFIRVATAKFGYDTTGADLDAFARKALVDEGKDYAHGTGHGVGSFLSVHEGPQSISKHSSVTLRLGMILSIEPGFYKEGEYGIRIENLAFVKESDSQDMLEFQLLTKVPIQEKLVDFDMLSDEEAEWFRKYNKSCDMMS